MSWWETARVGDQFGRDLRFRPFIVVEPWDGRRLRAYRKDVGVVWLRADDLRPCSPRYVDNARQRIAGAVEAGAVVELLGGVGYGCYPFAVERPDGSRGGECDTADEVAALLVPDDWQPPGGAS